jgi:hypothetical protein
MLILRYNGPQTASFAQGFASAAILLTRSQSINQSINRDSLCSIWHSLDSWHAETQNCMDAVREDEQVPEEVLQVVPERRN